MQRTKTQITIANLWQRHLSLFFTGAQQSSLRVAQTLFFAAALLSQSSVWAAGPQCNEVYGNPQAATTFAADTVSFRIKTFLEWRKVRKETIPLVENKQKIADAYQKFFDLVDNYGTVITETRFLQIFKKLPALDVNPELKETYFNRLISISKSNLFTKNESFLHLVVTKIATEDILNDPMHETLNFIIRLSSTQNAPTLPFIEAISLQAKVLAERDVSRKLILRRLYSLKQTSQQLDLSGKDLQNLGENLKWVSRYCRSSCFSPADLILLLAGQWGSARPTTYRIMSDHEAAKAMMTTATESKYTQNRGLLGDNSYQLGFVSGFKNRVFNLRSDQVWLDVGAGQFQAINDYFRQGGKAKVIGAAIETSPNSGTVQTLLRNYRDRFRALLGHPIEAFGENQIGRVDLITDFYGALSYSPHPDIIMQKYLDVLNDGGHIDIFLMNPSTAIFVKGEAFRLVDWIGTIPGISYSYRTEPSGAMAIQITKVSPGPVEVPTLNLSSYRMTLPATRTYFIE